MDDEMKDEGDVFNDIDDLFQGLSQELDQMLTLHGWVEHVGGRAFTSK